MTRTRISAGWEYGARLGECEGDVRLNAMQRDDVPFRALEACCWRMENVIAERHEV